MFILRATFQHAKNLAFLTTIYKMLLLLLKKLQGRTLPFHNFIGAFVAGYFVFGENNKVNMQVNKSEMCTVCSGTILASHQWVGQTKLAIDCYHLHEILNFQEFF